MKCGKIWDIDEVESTGSVDGLMFGVRERKNSSRTPA